MYDVTPPQRERISKFGEEMSEAGQVLGKINLHGWTPTSFENITYDNRGDLEREIGDILAAIDLMAVGGDIDMKKVQEFREAKRKTITRYMQYQQGIVLK